MIQGINTAPACGLTRSASSSPIVGARARAFECALLFDFVYFALAEAPEVLFEVVIE